MTDRHRAIYVEDKWTLPKIYANVLSRLLHAHGGKELPFYLAKSGACLYISSRYREQTAGYHRSGSQYPEGYGKMFWTEKAHLDYHHSL
jgi:hypothetical protein